jgi:hypothetical protein
MKRHVSLAVCAAMVWAWAPAARSAESPAMPKVVELQVLPSALALVGARDSRGFLVRGKTADGAWFDLTRSAAVTVVGDAARVEAGFVEPVKDGRATVEISVGGLKASLPVTVAKAAEAAPVSFMLDVMPILGKSGCNSGTCHGGAKGRNGFKLSLRGYDPAFDHEQIVEELAGRRIDRREPSNSLILLKPTQGVAHEGRFLFAEDSRWYRLIRQWVAQGAGNDAETAKRTVRIEVLPASAALTGVGTEQQLLVLAHFPDGSTRDVTREAVYSSSVETVVTVTGDGLVKGIRKGEAAVLIRYEGQFAVAPAAVLVPSGEFRWTEPPANNVIDTLVYKKLQSIKVLPSELAGDADFLRRVYLDLIGVPPTPEEVRAFLADARDSKTKRAAVIDTLLERPEYADYWTLRWADVLQVNRKFLGEKGTWAFRNWIWRQVASDRPWNETAHDLITGVGGTLDSPSSAFYRIAREPGQAVENMTHLFLGIRFNCNKCHDHPFERWTLGDYYQLAAYFAQVGIKKSARRDDEVVYEKRDGGEVTHPKTNQRMEPRFPFTHAGVNAKAAPAGTRRDQLAAWVTSKENPYFAKSMANRLWSYLTGRGIIEPADDIRAGNPASNAELLDALTQEFLRNGMRVKPMLRMICNSRVYQLSIVPNGTNADDFENFSRARPRRLSAEQLLDSVRVATGTRNTFTELPAGFRAAQLPDPTAGAGLGFLEQFGRPVRESPCECERRNEMSLGQALTLVNGPTISNAIAEPTGRIAVLFRNKAEDAKVVEEIYLAALSRPPSREEMENGVKALSKFADKQQGAQDLLWALLNTPAFLFNR